MERAIEPEWLDQLPAEHPQALGSRADLCRLNRWMGNAALMAAALSGEPASDAQRRTPRAAAERQVVELGAGDGSFLLRVARRLKGWGRTRAVLVDRHALLSSETRRGFAGLGWQVESARTDLFEWLASGSDSGRELFVSNLVLHHFSADELTRLFEHAARRARLFVAVEPRRSWLALWFSRLVWLLGCNPVTRHDAPISVRAGFRGQELSGLWPRLDEWRLEERAAGPFSHVFAARLCAP